LSGLVNAPGKLASDRVEQSSRAPPEPGALEDAGAVGSVLVAAAPGAGEPDGPPEVASTATTAVAITIAAPIQVFMYEHYARGVAAVPAENGALPGLCCAAGFDLPA
jgi:hypothetical protein